MKTFRLLFILFVTITISSFTSKAQNYWSYDCDEFSVQVKTAKSDKIVVEVEFSDPVGDDHMFNWEKCQILKSQDLSKSKGKGWLYTVKSADGVEYTIKYKKKAESIEVIRTKDKKKWICEQGKG